MNIAKLMVILAAASFASQTTSIFVKDPAELENLQQNLENLKTELGESNPQVDDLLNRASKIAEMNNRCSMISINDVLDDECSHFYSVDLPEFEDMYMEVTGEVRLNSVKMGNTLAERTEQIQVCASALGGILVPRERLLKLDGKVDLEPLDLAGAFDATYDFTLYFDPSRLKQQKTLVERWMEKCGDVVIRKAGDEFAPLFVDRVNAVNDSLEKNNVNIKIILNSEKLDIYQDLSKPVSGAYFLSGAQLFDVAALPSGMDYAHFVVNLRDQKVEQPLGTQAKLQNFRGRVEFTAAYQEKDLMGRWIWGNQKEIKRAKVKGQIAAKDAAQNNNGSKKSWIPTAVAGVVMIGGGVMAAVFNNKAKKESEKEASTRSEYDDRCDKIKSAQNMRAVGFGIAAAGLVGVGVTLLF